MKTSSSVQMAAGKDKGKLGKVECIFPKARPVIVEDMNTRMDHRRLHNEGKAGQIITHETLIHSLNVMLHSEKARTVSRVYYMVWDGERVRTLKKTGEVFAN